MPRRNNKKNCWKWKWLCDWGKKNQKKLYKKVEEITQNELYCSIDLSEEKNRGRFERREVKVYEAENKIDNKWVGVKSCIKVTRTVEYKGKERFEEAYYISSLNSCTDAKIFNKGIRNHWGIENRLHYVKDVTFKEDNSKIRVGNAPGIFSVIRNIAINIFSENGYSSIPQGIRLIANNIGLLKKFIFQ